MEENKKDKLSEIDKLLQETSSENRLKFEIIEPVIIPESENDDEFSEDIRSILDVPTTEDEPVEYEEETTVETKDEDEPETVCIIDETSTTIELSNSVEIYEDSPTQKVKKPKQKVKFNAGQIILMCVFGLALLWCVFFTADHTLASFGRAPIFSREVQTYEDGSVSFKGLGYKVQFSFDSNNNLTQKCVPFWEDGPNDLIDQGGSAVSFE